MTRYFLAIPGIALLFCLLLSPALAQTTPTLTPFPSTSATAAPLSPERLG